MKKTFIILILIFLSIKIFGQGFIVPTGQTQEKYLKTYKMVLEACDKDFRRSSTTLDSRTFPVYSEFSVYWCSSGDKKGSFIYTDTLPSSYSDISVFPYSSYTWQNASHYSIQFKKDTSRVAIFRSKLLFNENSVSWEAVYFQNLFNTFLFKDMYFIVTEEILAKENILTNTDLLIIPSFAVNEKDNKYYIDQVANQFSGMKNAILNFLAKGGTLYLEGNAVYYLEKLGILNDGAVNFNNLAKSNGSDNLLTIDYIDSENPLTFAKEQAGNNLYATSIPLVNVDASDIIAYTRVGNYPAVFSLNGAKANGGRIICNLGLPTVGGYLESNKNGRQLQWTLNSIMYAFAHNVDVTRAVYNDIPQEITATRNSLSYNEVDAFEVRIKLRNLSSKELQFSELKENIHRYFKFNKVIGSITGIYNNNELIFKGISIPAFSETEIVYQLSTPASTDAMHDSINQFVDKIDEILVSSCKVSYSDESGEHNFLRNNNKAVMMFSANIIADTDLNWKNFLGLEYQSFKVFCIMENKERTSGLEGKYVQYIPKDIPFYWVDHGLQIPILKTPGGKFVDVLRGSNDQNNPEFDMDSDGKPDAWLDTASIYPKGYTITEDSVYWRNPWSHLKSSDSTGYFEDINHDGNKALDKNNDGKPDNETKGDKIRVWKVTWNIGEIPGYQYYDPYCSYEIWVDPPDLVKMAAGIGYANGKVKGKFDGMFYPYSDINKPDKKNESWKHWMNTDSKGNVIWKQMITQNINNYMGYAYVDTATYNFLPSDSLIGTVPWPNDEYIAVLSLGGDEIDMTHPTPANSYYSKVTYKTIFGESKTTPVRTTYTYYIPLPNPLQFEYLTNNYQAKDIRTDMPLKTLPSSGKAKLIFNLEASTEYSYYWIRNAGTDVHFNDPSLTNESVDNLGDGVFGYMIYDVPKGIGGYNISFAKNNDGSYNMDTIVRIEGKPFQKWIDNPNTKNNIEIWEDAFQYHIYIPQLLIPPAIDDDNHDGMDDWIDDRGDRFKSETGYLQDPFMSGNGEEYSKYPSKPFQDDIWGTVTSGWYAGKDGTYGDDQFEKPGKVSITINAIYEGKGKEGPVEVSKGGWLVVEEIFGGSPWTIFSHTLSGYAEGVNYTLISQANPTALKAGLDTTYIKHVIKDENEPHYFDHNFDPYHQSLGYKDATFTSYAGGKDPCSLISPSIRFSTIIDPKNTKDLQLIPWADSTISADLKGYPKVVKGSYLLVQIEVTNGSEYNWKDVTIDPIIGISLGNTQLIMNYGAYPRPLVPGDDIGAFKSGWRFNQPENEVLVKMGNRIPEIQPTRRAYFILLFSIDQNLQKGIYKLDFKTGGTKINYKGDSNGKVDYEVPSVKFCIIGKDPDGNIEYPKMIIGQGSLKNIETLATAYFTPMENVKWSDKDVNYQDFPGMTKILNAVFDPGSRIETINLTGFSSFPSVDTMEIYIMEQGQVNTLPENETTPKLYSPEIPVTTKEVLNYEFNSLPYDTFSGAIIINASGPKIVVEKSIYSVNGKRYLPQNSDSIPILDELQLVALIKVTNQGNDISQNTIIDVNLGPWYKLKQDTLNNNFSFKDGILKLDLGAITPGESKENLVSLSINENQIMKKSGKKLNLESCDMLTVVCNENIKYKGTQVPRDYEYLDLVPLQFSVFELRLDSIETDQFNYTHKEKIKFTINVTNGLLPVQNVWLRFYSISKKGDTIKLAEKFIENLSSSEKYSFNTEYLIGDSIYRLKFFARIDDERKFLELTKKNNTKTHDIIIKGPPGFIHVKNYPNPFKNSTTISYTLPGDMKEISLYIYSSDRKVVKIFNNCPNSIGENLLKFDGYGQASGTYIIKFIGKDMNDKFYDYLGKILKVK